jgi:biopolymer transport protein ExbD
MADTVKLSSAQRAKVRRLSKPKELAPDEEGGELNIVPFLDIIMNILIFVLATISVTFTATITSTPPSSRGNGVRAAAESSSLDLTVIVVNDGFSIKASGGSVAPGCDGVGPGISIPKKGESYDYDGLTQCVQKLKNSNPDFEAESQASLTCNPDVPFQVVVSVMDALRNGKDGTILFEEISFKVAR